MQLRKLIGIVYRRLTPLNWQYFIDCQRAKRSWLKRKVIFIHIPKSAGISLSTALYGKPLGHIPFFAIRRFLGEDVGNYYCFTYIREPKARFISAVNYARENWDEIKGSKGLPSKKVLFGDIDTLLKVWLLGKSDNKLNYIFKSQSFFVSQTEGFVDLFPFDDISEAGNIIKKKTGFSVELQKMNSSGGKNIVLSNESERFLEKIYEKDFFLYEKVKGNDAF